MANATITGNSGANAATVTNSTDGSGRPSQNPSNVTVTTSNATVSGTGAFYDVNFLAGNDTLIGENVPWANPSSGASVAFDNISMGDGEDLVDLQRSGFQGTIDMGDGQDTLILENSSGREVDMGLGDDLTQLDFSQAGAASEEELSQKVGQAPVAVDGGLGRDTLDLVGDWTITLSAGSFTLDTDNDGTGDTTTTVLRADQYGEVVSMPAVLSGTVQWGDTITLGNGDTVVSQATFSNFEALEAVCFTEGTMIKVPGGETRIEDLREGDLVKTRNGPKPIRWIGKRRLDLVDLMANPKLLPILIPEDAFGEGRPNRDVYFSPQHRIMVRSKIVRQMFDEREVLVPARLLCSLDGIEVDGNARSVTYYHFMMDDHEVVKADGIWAETLFPGPNALSFLSPGAREEVLTLFPEVFDTTNDPEPALPMIKGRDARALIARHKQSEQSLWS